MIIKNIKHDAQYNLISNVKPYNENNDDVFQKTIQIMNKGNGVYTFPLSTDKDTRYFFRNIRTPDGYACKFFGYIEMKIGGMRMDHFSNNEYDDKMMNFIWNEYGITNKCILPLPCAITGPIPQLLYHACEIKLVAQNTSDIPTFLEADIYKSSDVLPPLILVDQLQYSDYNGSKINFVKPIRKLILDTNSNNPYIDIALDNDTVITLNNLQKNVYGLYEIDIFYNASIFRNVRVYVDDYTQLKVYGINKQVIHQAHGMCGLRYAN